MIRRDEADALPVELARLATDNERLRGHWQILLADVETALACRRNPGGQQAGTPHLIAVPLSTLLRLQRDARHALEGT